MKVLVCTLRFGVDPNNGHLCVQVRKGCPFYFPPGNSRQMAVIHAAGKEFKVPIISPITGNSPTHLSVRRDPIADAAPLLFYAEDSPDTSKNWVLVYGEMGSGITDLDWSDLIETDFTGDPDDANTLGEYDTKSALMLLDLSENHTLNVNGEDVVLSFDENIGITAEVLDDEEED